MERGLVGALRHHIGKQRVAQILENGETLGMVGGMYWLVLWLVAYSALDFLYTQVAALRRVS